MMSEAKGKCEVKFIVDENDWKIQLSGDCQETIEKVNALPPRKKNYAKRRIQA
jgi:hypothetical protein